MNNHGLPPHAPVSIVTVFAAVLSLLGLMLLALHGHGGPEAGWMARILHPAPTAITLTPGPGDHESGHFARCHGPGRYTCVIDGDTIWYKGSKIRVADINAPEVSEPACDAELELGEKATARMTELLNQGAFSLVPLPSKNGGGRDVDVYGRKLRSITRGGHSLGAVLVAEGLAERWVGFRRDWCD